MVGIIGAMEEEVRELIEDMTECEMQEKASMKFYKGQLYGKEAVVVQSGIGKVNAGICTQILIDFYQVDQLINTGVAGSVEANKKANSDIRTFTGRVASGDQFISEKEVKERIVNNFGAKCAEMEGAAIAHGAYLNHVPCVIIRAISDKADGSAQVDYPTFEKQAIVHGVKLMKELLPTL